MRRPHLSECDGVARHGSDTHRSALMKLGIIGTGNVGNAIALAAVTTPLRRNGPNKIIVIRTPIILCSRTGISNPCLQT
jgi:hypothetical protein